VRLRALETDPLSFGSTYERESVWERSEWERWASEHASGNDKATFLAFREDVVVGIVGALREAADRTSVHVFSMWVAPDVRRLGIAQRLVQAVVAWATASGASSLNLWVTQSGARELYASCGFVDDGTRQPLPSAPDIVEYGMSRKL
jgi:GNAT superfamily N-acetyltransferase